MNKIYIGKYYDILDVDEDVFGKWYRPLMKRGNGIKYGFKYMVKKWLHSCYLREVAFGAVGYLRVWVTTCGSGVYPNS